MKIPTGRRTAAASKPTAAPGKIGNRNAKIGRVWEDVVGPMFAHLRDADIRKTSAPFRILRAVPPGAFGGPRFEGFFEQKAFCDFSGWFRGIHVEIEAKRFSDNGETWNFKAAIKPHQADRLTRNRAAGGLSGVVLMTADGLFGIPWEVIENAIGRGRKSFTVPDLRQASTAVDQIPGVRTSVHDLRADGGLAPFMAALLNRRIQP